jgi:hypothetical protein
VVIGFGGPWWGWWPAYYPYYYPYYGYAGYYPYYGGDYPYYSAPTYDYGSVYVQKPDAGYFETDPNAAPQQPQAQPQPQSAPRPPRLQYYCTDPAGYYPQVQSCANWLRVLPSTVPGPSSPTQY